MQHTLHQTTASLILDQELVQTLARVGRETGTDVAQAICVAAGVALYRYQHHPCVAAAFSCSNESLEGGPEAVQSLDADWQGSLSLRAMLLKVNPVGTSTLPKPSQAAGDPAFTIAITRGEAGLLVTISVPPETALPFAAHDFLKRVHLLLAQASVQPDKPLGEIELITEAEKRQLLDEWNHTGRGYPLDRLVHELIAEQARQRPASVAVRFGPIELSYTDLNRRANQLAHYLRSLGVGPEVVVGVCLERSEHMVVALLSVLKAGGAYLPLDSDLPTERLAFIMADAGARHLITNRLLANTRVQVEAQTIHTIYVEDLAEQLAGWSGQEPGKLATADNIAYVIYTSGSTGQPKGVPIPHLGLTNRLLWMQEAFALSPADRVLQKTPFSFDVSVWEFFWPLIVGACLVVAPPGAHRDSRALVRLIQHERITVLHFVPSMLDVFLAELGAQECSSLRLVFCSGEALTRPLVDTALDLLGAQLHNLYGPTEASIDVSHWACEPSHRRQDVPIGRPIAHTQLYVLDNCSQLAPPGYVGELYIAGLGLARGYINRPQLTAERFTPNPFSHKHGRRMYRTGDLARYAPDGNLEYHGRIDHQVKLRGFRIELGEIEAVLDGHPSVRKSVAIVRAEAGGSRLTAYVLSAPGSAPSTVELREYLVTKLPAYMIPQAIMQLDEFPLTVSGKIDRQGLPAPAIMEPGAGYTGLRGPHVEYVRGLWAEVLGLVACPEDADFFSLGGDSLQAMRALGRVQRDLGIEISVSQFFSSPTVKGLSAAITDEMRKGHTATPPPIEKALRDKPVPASFAQERLWFVMQLDPESPAYNMCNGMWLPGEVPVELVQRCLDRLIERHEALRTTFALGDDHIEQVIGPPQSCALEVVDLRCYPLEGRQLEALRLLEEFGRRLFDLDRGPLVRSLLIRCSQDEQVLAFCMHHIVSDGWSWEIMAAELSVLYDAFSEGHEPRLPTLTIQYADFAAWQRSVLTDGLLRPQLRWWSAHLAEPLPVLQLPIDGERPPQFAHLGATIEFYIEHDLGRLFVEFCRTQRATTFMGLLAILSGLLSRLSGQDDVIIATPVAGRTRPEVELLVGFFVGTQPLRIKLGGSPSYEELVRRAREVTLGAYANQDVPFERLVEHLAPKRQANRMPFFDVMLILQNTPGLAINEQIHKWRRFEIDNGASKYDLKFDIAPSEGGFTCLLEYSRALFTEERIRTMAGQFVNLMEQVLAMPSESIHSIPLNVSLLLEPPQGARRLFN
jgi:amino acid adenylation domain-containing protein